MAQEIKKISVDGVVYNIATTSSSETGDDVQEQLDSLTQKTEELDKKIVDEATRTDGMINQVNENVASSIQALNDNLVSAINTINGGVAAEVTNREEGDKALEEKIIEETTAREELENEVKEIQKTLESLNGSEEKIEEEKTAREDADNKLDEKIDSSVKTLNETIATVNQNIADSIQTLNNNMVDAINTINGGIDNEIRPELEKTVKWGEDKTGCGERTIELGATDTISSLDSEGEAHNIASVSSVDGKLHLGSVTSPMNLNSSERITVNDTEQIAYLSDVATDQDFESLKTQVEENTTKIEETNTTLVDAVGGLNESINTKTEELNTRIDTEILQKINNLEQEKVGLVETDKNGIKTKNIVLENYASLLGKDTQGTMYNLAMVSKWNKADFGSGSIVLNLNGSAERPTYNDDVELALLTDVTGNLNTVQLVKKSDLEYELQVGDRIAGTINIPEDQFFEGSEYNSETHILTLTFKTSDGDQSQDIDLSDLIDVYTAGNGLALEGGSFSIKLDPSTDAYLEVTGDGLKLVGIKNALDAETEARSAKDIELQGNIEAEAEARIEKDTELEEAISKKIEWTNIETEDNPERKAIILGNHDCILGATTEGSANNLIMMSKWNKVDVGTAQNELNLNGSAEHPTYNDTEELAFLKDLEDINEGIEVRIPVRTLKDEVYDKATILGWFGVEDEVGLKQLIAYKGQMYIKWGISLSTNPHYYRMPIQYAAFESATQVKLVVLGLDTSNDAPVKYEIVINLDGTVVSGNSNIGVTMTDLATKEDIQAAQPDLSGFATKNEVALKADQTKVDELEEKVTAITIPTKVSELENDATYQTAQDVDQRIQDLINAAPAELDTLGEIAKALQDNESVVGALTSEIATKATTEALTTEQGAREAKDTELEGMIALKASQTDLDAEVTARQEADNIINAALEEKADKTELEGLATKTELQTVANSKLYYPGVKIDTQKLFALTKESTEDDIKAALQLSVASGGYTLPTSTILDECLGKGYQLLSNWMPVSVVWNGAAYVFYIVGQSYMMQPTGLYTVAISITDGVYSVFQAAKFEKFVNTDELNKKLEEYQKVDVLTYNDDWDSAKAKIANGVKTIVDDNNLQWTITLTKEEPINETNTLKVIAFRSKSPYSDDIDTAYGFGFAQFTLAEGAEANHWSKVESTGDFISEYSINKMIDEKLVDVNSNITLLSDKVALLENKYNQLVFDSSEKVEDFTGGDTINDSSKSVVVESAAIQTTSTVNAKSVVMNNSSLSENARMKVNASNVEMNNLAVSGDFPKTDGNAVMSINDAETVVYKNMTFDSSNVYNGIEIGLNSNTLPKNVLFDNCKFTGAFSNNAILVFGTQDNATITLNNCSFDKVSNGLRLSNKSNVSGVTVNILNCSVGEWDSNLQWRGFLICEDYTSKTEEEANTNNLFAPEKITVNFVNLTLAGEKILPSNVASVCGSKDENQVVVVCQDAITTSDYCIDYDKTKFPTVTFK